MHKKLLNVTVACVTLLSLVALYGPSQGRPASAQGDCQTFPETNNTVCGKFLQYWKDHGGLAQQGYPISGQFNEVSDVDGKTYTVQYFERAVFELHPENKAPYDVLLSLLGSIALKQKYPHGAPVSTTTAIGSDFMDFPQTGQRVSGDFLAYWKSHGGLAQQGYPISGQFSEQSDLNGKTYIVQYFERAVFELHAELASPNDVLLSQLGTEQFRQKYPNGVPGSGGGGTAIKAGQWGGQSVNMIVQANSVHFEFDCAHADISQAITVDSSGNFDVTGIYVQEHGGPVYVGDDQGRPARFTGSTDGTNLEVTITYTDDNSKIGSWKVTFGAQGQVHKCL